MTQDQAIKILDELAEAKAQADVLRLDYAELHAKILAPVQGEIDALDAEMLPRQEAIAARIADLTEQVRGIVVNLGATVNGSRIQAVYVKGRESWDTKGISGYAVAHPEILTFRKIGEPSVSLRDRK